MRSQNKTLEDKAANINVNNAKYLLISEICCVGVALILMVIAQGAGVDLTIWWAVFMAVALIISFEIAALFAQKRYEKFKTQLGDISLGLKRAHYVAVKSKWYARVFRWFICPAALAPVCATVFHIKIKMLLMICFAILHTQATSLAAKKATAETGYSPTTAKK